MRRLLQGSPTRRGQRFQYTWSLDMTLLLTWRLRPWAWQGAKALYLRCPTPRILLSRTCRDDPPLTVDYRPSERKWRTSQQVPFAARMVFERFSCSDSSDRFQPNMPYIRLMLNASPFPLSTCQDMDDKYGSCTLADFTASNKASTDIVWGDAQWNQTCGNAGF